LALWETRKFPRREEEEVVKVPLREALGLEPVQELALAQVRGQERAQELGLVLELE